LLPEPSYILLFFKLSAPPSEVVNFLTGVFYFFVRYHTTEAVIIKALVWKKALQGANPAEPDSAKIVGKGVSNAKRP
jgi:hypothetical protein